MEKVGSPAQPKRTEVERLGDSTHRALVDATFLNQLTRNGRLAYIPFNLHDGDAWTVLFLAVGLSEQEGHYTNPGNHQRFEILSELVAALTTAESWSRTHQVPVLTCPADDRVRCLFESRGLSDWLYISVAEFLERLERAFLGSLDKGRPAKLRVFPGGGRSSAGDDDRRTVATRGAEALERPILPTGQDPDDRALQGDATMPIEAMLASNLFSIEEPRRQLRLRLKESHDRIAGLEQHAGELVNRIAWLESELHAVHQSRGWRLVSSLAQHRRRLLPAGTRRARLVSYCGKFITITVNEGPVTALAKGAAKIRRRISPSPIALASPPALSLEGPGLVLPAVAPPPAPVPHDEMIDVVVWVDREYAEARACLESVVRSTRPPYRLILVNDGSDASTLGQLEGFAVSRDARLVTDPAATSLAVVMHLASRLSDAESVAFVRCTTEVAHDWLDRLAECLKADERVGIAVPLSNRLLGVPPAGREGEDDPFGSAGEGTPDTNEVASRIGTDSGRLHPRLSRFDDDCLLLRRRVLTDGHEVGGQPGADGGWLPSADAWGWTVSLADDAYVRVGPATLPEPCRPEAIRREQDHPAAVPRTESDRILEGIRVRTRHLNVRHAIREDGRRRWEGKRVLILLQASLPCGGANVIFQEAVAMRAMGVEVRLVNLESHREIFQASYPDLELPATYVASPADLPLIARGYDAVIATYFPTVEWMRPLREFDPPPRLGYYVQDFEPYFAKEYPIAFWEAWSSYLAYPELIPFTKTEWNRDEVRSRTGADCLLVGPSVNVDLFRPRPRLLPGRPDVVRIAAMVRPISPYRQPRQTMEVLRAVHRTHGDRVEILIFGCRPDELGDLPRDFPFRNAGVVNPKQLAALLNEIELFVDLSSHQAMGLTAMEAMCCGATVVVPSRGGSASFVRQEENGLIVNSARPEECTSAVNRLVREASLLRSLQARALRDIGRFFPERAAYRILEALFSRPAGPR
jgi:glycosyltransferase involved in cell wall biosynthesis